MKQVSTGTMGTSKREMRMEIELAFETISISSLHVCVVIKLNNNLICYEKER